MDLTQQIFWEFSTSNGWEFKDPNSTCFHIFFNQTGGGFKNPPVWTMNLVGGSKKSRFSSRGATKWRYDKGFDLVIFGAKDSVITVDGNQKSGEVSPVDAWVC